MPSDSFPSLQPIPYPESLAPYLEHLERTHLELTAQDLAETLETGALPGGDHTFPDSLWREYLVFILVEVLNDVIESLNIIIEDVEDLPRVASTLKGKPSKRIDLLVRGFYAEAFRGREVIRKIIGHLRRRGFVSRGDAKAMADAMQDQLGGTVTARHAFTHGEAGLTGKSVNLLRAFEGVPDGEFIRGDGTPLNIGDVAAATCREKAEAMRGTGLIYRATYSAMVEKLAGVHGPTA